MKLYKLTDRNGKTHGGCQWGKNVTHGEDELLEGEGPLCSEHWYHAYQDPILAVLMNPAHANFKSPRLWEAEGTVGKIEPDKVGCKGLTTLREIPLPDVTTIQKQAFAILGALEVYDNPKFVAWAEKWLSGVDRSVAAAYAAAAAAAAAYAAYAATSAAYAATSAAADADGAAYAAAYAVACADAIDPVAIAHKAMEY